MHHRIVLFLMLSFCCLTSYGQVRTLSDAQRKSQQDFIRQDTLPVNVSALPSEINSPFSEYAGRLFADSTFIFSSMRADVEEDYDQLFETSWYCNLYQSRLLSDGSYLPAVPLPSIINSRNAFNSNYCFNEQRDQIIFSRCVKNGNGELQCALWQSAWNGKTWARPQKLPANINAPGSSNMQPCLVSYPDYDVLYFVSNRSQGLGGLDIWYSIYKNEHFEVPINLGATINTEGNEVTPFYDKGNSTLYFSSDEHLGIGDYDIFYSAGALSQWGEVSNMGVPFNSEYNDYYFTLNHEGRSGYFSSNRPHDKMSTSDTCCNDLFHFQWKEQEKDTVVTPTDTLTIAEKIASVLPITLYFQNDQPNPKTSSDTTEFSYPTLYQHYLKDINLYIAESGNGLSGIEKEKTLSEMSRFLNDSVVTGYQRLLLLKEYLKEALAAGETVTLHISGFASPLHNSKYNTHLSSRRIVSLLNYLRSADNGYFLPYLNGSKPRLRIISNPEGAVQHDFKSADKRETVFGVQAAKDRRIVISEE